MLLLQVKYDLYLGLGIMQEVKILPGLTISQGGLQVWDACRRKFQYIYLEDCQSLPAIAAAKGLELGSQFHLLVQQSFLGQDIRPWLAGQPKLQRWYQAFELFRQQLPSGEYLPEHRRCWGDQGVGVNVIYDLLVLGRDQAVIFDWKTHQHPIRMGQLRQQWQTRLYLYVLAKTSAYACKDLSMVYWFANRAEQVRIGYSDALHAEIEEDLSDRLQEIRLGLETKQDWPRLARTSEVCGQCQFYYRCWSDVGQELDYPEIEV
ncbi:MAG: PD-(D/E)XK nuclease family protein [Pseudanabaenaceae cyanobacterium bins.68]|nr:PD-(D/E)XK nuclease family protein [Pseudanabaenaceae cyanobacterium bins.68]